MLGPVRLSELEEEKLLNLLKRNKPDIKSCRETVLQILDEVREKGDDAIIKYTELYDKVKISKNELKITKAEIMEAYEMTSENLIKAMEEASKNLREIHEKQLPKEKILKRSDGIRVKQVFKPLNSVGLYIPGGRASYPSTALMLGIPAKVAGVRKLVACTPPTQTGKVNPAVLVALEMAGITDVYRVGGVQAIGALAYGTKTIPKVDKIVGPGNIYVTTAKIMVYGDVGVDFPAGPSEILIFADETASSSVVVADMLSQAEHDPLSVSILITTSEKLAFEVEKKLIEFLPRKARRNIIEDSLKNNGAILIVEDEKEAISFINRFAPEHLEIMTKKPNRVASLIENAGSISLGKYTPVAAVDYAVGVCHVLPTGGASHFHSGLTVHDFLKIFHIQQLTKQRLRKLRNVVKAFSEVEGLVGHVEALDERFKS